MLTLSSYFSVLYLAAVLPGVVLAYAVLPRRIRWVVFLLSSYAVFWLVSRNLLVYLLFTTLSVHYIGLWLADARMEADQLLENAPNEERKEIRTQYHRKQRAIAVFGIAVQLGILLTLKCGAFFISNINVLARLVKAPVELALPSVVLPIGISFYTMQAMSYMLDVYQGKIPVDRNLMRLALYMSFFPQLMEGPICRYADTSQQLWEAPADTLADFTLGLQRILWGIMKKVVLADRLNLLIRNVFDEYEKYDSFVIAIAAVTVRTAVLVCTGELFFRANGLLAGMAMFQKILTDFTLTTLKDKTLFTFGADQKDFVIVYIGGGDHSSAWYLNPTMDSGDKHCDPFFGLVHFDLVHCDFWGIWDRLCLGRSYLCRLLRRTGACFISNGRPVRCFSCLAYWPCSLRLLPCFSPKTIPMRLEWKKNLPTASWLNWKTPLGTPDRMAGTDTSATTNGQQATPQGPQGAANGPTAVERDNGRQPDGP